MFLSKQRRQLQVIFQRKRFVTPPVLVTSMVTGWFADCFAPNKPPKHAKPWALVG